jgi:proteasome lid subunit RPN8/RPN11
VSRLDVRAVDAGDLPARPFPAVRQGFRVHIAEAALDRITRRAGEQPDKEVGGVLVGELLRDDAGPYLAVETTIDALHAEEKGTELTFTHATWDHIHEEMDARHQGRRIVGWYHTHPGFGIFLSDRDQFIQQSFFNLPHQIALVYDPRRREHGVFVWRDGEPVRCPRYWVGREECLWEPTPGAEAPAGPGAAAGGRRSGGRRDDGEEESMRERATPGAEAPRSEWSEWSVVGMAAAAALVAGLLIGAWWAGRGSEKLAAEAQRRIDQAHLTAAEETVKLLNAEVLSYLRRLVDDDAARLDLLQAADAVDRALRALEAGGGRDQAVASLREARELLAGLGRSQSRAHQSLRALELLARSGLDERRDAAGDLARQRAALAGLHLELAEQAAAAGDRDRARRLLRTAAAVDPENPTYAERLVRLEEAGGE